MYPEGRETFAGYARIVLRASQDVVARAIDHRETLWIFPLMRTPEGSQQICPISNEGERES